MPVAGHPFSAIPSANGCSVYVSLAGIAGATIPEMKINSTAVAGGLQVAVGSANGYPAVWRRTSAGAWTLVSSLGLVAAAGLYVGVMVVRTKEDADPAQRAPEAGSSAAARLTRIQVSRSATAQN